MSRWRLAATFVLLVVSSASRWDEEATGAGATRLAEGEVELVFLANEGFLVRSSDSAFVIDAFLETPLSPYAALPPELHARLVAAEAPFDDVDLALVSHVHPDHFQPDSARGFLASSEDTVLATSPQVIESLATRLEAGEGAEGAAGTIRTRLEAFLPEPGEVLAFEHAGIEVAFLRLPHAGRRPGIQNLGHLIQFAGLTLLHVGDAEGAPDVFEPYGLAEIDIDVALLPYWYWSSPGGKQLVETQLAADTLVAIHVPPGEVAGLREALAAQESGVHVFRAPLETLRVKAE